MSTYLVESSIAEISTEDTAGKDSSVLEGSEPQEIHH